MTDYLFNRSQIVDINNICSADESIYCGVPQGSIMGPLLFIIFFDDLEVRLKHSTVIKYADDTVLYVSSNDFHIIESNLNADMEIVSEYFRENELIINLKKGKTEVMLFRTAQRLRRNNKNALEIVYQGQKVNVVTKYKYLGTVVDNHLSLTENFDKTHKTASSRLRLLQHMRSFLTSDAALNIYLSMVVPFFTYSSTLKVILYETELKKLESLDNRAKNIIKTNKSIPKIISLVKRDQCLVVKKCLLKEFATNTFNEYFTTQQHSKQTRNNQCSVRLPRVKLETARRGFYFAGGSLYNSLPTDIRSMDTSNVFKEALVSHFS